ncbi:XPC-binding domain/UBA/TS-N domain containing protein [Novymonas esmeraldas]|uniref:XPC-binding domain/UBA/TS-N domain containing protein n=1 Tax=Novymonas esmeraldas TaxID=1808958 RepID=A0AAW0F4E4_9TRYP
MRFTVTCFVSSVNSAMLSKEAATTKEITVANPQATVQNLRATVAIQFRINVMAFEFHLDRHDDAGAPADGETPESSPNAVTSPLPPQQPQQPVVDFSDEKRLLAECGLRDGDHLSVVPKNHSSSAVTAAALDSPATKRARVEATAAGLPSTESAVTRVMDEEEEESELDEEDEEEDEEEEGGDGEGRSDLFDALREVVPDVTVLRQEFLANPQGVMERIERLHPSLFQVITQNQRTFVALMNNEGLAKAAQGMLHGGLAGSDGDEEDEEGSLEWSMGEEGEEMDEDEEMAEAEEQLNALIHDYIASGGGGGGDGAAGDFDAADLAELEASGMRVEELDSEGNGADGEDNNNNNGGGGSSSGTGAHAKAPRRQSDKAFILSRTPSEEEEKKIQALTELGFSYDQCKLAFYLCHRSVDRASNMLFEAPPEL